MNNGGNEMYKVTLMANDLKKFVKLLTEMTNEAKIELLPDAMHARLVDDANAALIDVTLGREAFLEYDVKDTTTERPIVVGVDLVKLYEMIFSAGKLSEVVLEDVNGKIRISFDGMIFKLPALDPGTMKQTPRMPVLPFSVKTTIDSEFVKAILRGVKIVGGDVVIATDGSIVNFKSSSDEGNAFEFPVTVDGDFEHVESLYAIGYIKTLALFEGEIGVSYGTDIPAVFESVTENMKVLYMTAPRISK
jgi:DNA polymerase III sliding clamp (beta) subunit (PCNA family)